MPHRAIPLPSGVIDVHAHWLPEELFGLPAGSPLPPMNVKDGELHLGDLPLSIRGEDMTDALRAIADSDDAGLAVRVLSAPPFAFPIAPGDNHSYVSEFNEALTRVCQDSSGRLLGLGLVSLHDIDAARRELAELTRTPLIRGIALPPLVGAHSLDRDPLRAILRGAADASLAVIVHPMQLPRPEWTSYYLANLIGNPVETATAVASCIFGRVIDEIPELRIAFVHGGGCTPALLGRWQHGFDARPDVRSGGGRRPTDAVGDLWFDSLTHDRATLNLLTEHVGSERILCGSDYPFDMGTSDPLTGATSAGLTHAQLEHNAREFLGLNTKESDTHGE